ncbi:unnamed protein product [Owenia fusiformis]|uniref:Uncharacterized protein n=1 Tax=Owenia fusiformis TaxID=6347 RepID=A0A8J1TBA4_OWEFU|nr:unnamed protein product [Owenia fusiformis]
MNSNDQLMNLSSEFCTNVLAVFSNGHKMSTNSNMSCSLLGELNLPNNTGHTLNRSVNYEQVLWFISYGIVVTSICLFGIVCNCLNLIVLAGKHLQESPYTYLTALAVADLLTLILFFFTGLARGVFPDSHGWMIFQAHVYYPLAYISTMVGIFMTLALTIERLIFVHCPIRSRQLCNQTVARKVTICLTSFAIVFQFPRFFAYEVTENGVFSFTHFGKSLGYEIYSWIHLVVFSVGSCVAIAILNILLIHGVYKMEKRRKSLVFQKSSMVRQMSNQNRLTLTLISVVFLFLIGQLPSSFLSRGFITLVSGNKEILQSYTYRVASMVSMILVTLNHSLNFVIYCAFNKKFWAVFKQVFSRARRGSRVGSTTESSTSDSNPRSPYKIRTFNTEELSVLHNSISTGTLQSYVRDSNFTRVNSTLTTVD